MKSRNLKIMGAVLLAFCVICAAAAFLYWHGGRPADTNTSETEYGNEEPANDGDSAEEAVSPYVSPIDFVALRNKNPDIYAWIEIPGTVVDYAVVSREGDNRFYLDHDSDGNYSLNGALFTENYNSCDFEDPVTVIYGHDMRSGSMFGNLEVYYTDSDFFKENNVLNIYLPDGKFVYKIFAAVPYGNIHLLYYYNFVNERVFNSFFEDVFSIRSLNAVLDDSISVEAPDKVVVLSTCLKENNSERFLVMAVRQSDSAN